jgi:hypothetical protein
MAPLLSAARVDAAILCRYTNLPGPRTGRRHALQILPQLFIERRASRCFGSIASPVKTRTLVEEFDGVQLVISENQVPRHGVRSRASPNRLVILIEIGILEDWSSLGVTPEQKWESIEQNGERQISTGRNLVPLLSQ